MTNELQPELNHDGPAGTAAELHQPANVSGVHPAGPIPNRKLSIERHNEAVLRGCDGNPATTDPRTKEDKNGQRKI